MPVLASIRILLRTPNPLHVIIALTPDGCLGYDVNRADRRDAIFQHFDGGSAAAATAIESVARAPQKERLWQRSAERRPMKKKSKPERYKTIVFRYEAAPSDMQAVGDIISSTRFFNPAEVDIAVELVEDRLAFGDASGYFFVFAEEDGSVLGYTSYGPIAGTAESFDLYWIAIHRDQQNRGLGRVLMSETERMIHKAGGRRVYAETSGRPQYEPTRVFYERLGFSRETQLKDFYAPGDDKVFYVKVL
jgi:GNAT superfamily N-acetyltransferase